MLIVTNCLQAADTAHAQPPETLYYVLKAGAHASGILFTMACGWMKRKNDNENRKLISLFAAVPHAAGITAPLIRSFTQKKKDEQTQACIASDKSSWWLGMIAYFGSAIFHCAGGSCCFRAGKKLYSLKNKDDVVGYSCKTIQSLIPGLLYHAIGFALGEFAPCSMQECRPMKVRATLRGFENLSGVDSNMISK